MERLNGYVMKAHTTWLASTITCCFPRPQDQPEEDNEKIDEPESGASSRRQSPVPLSSKAVIVAFADRADTATEYNTAAPVTCQPQQHEPPRLHKRTNSHIVEEHNAYQDLRRVSKRTSTPQWFKEGQEMASTAVTKARRASRHSFHERESTTPRHNLSRRRRKAEKKTDEPAEPQRVCISPIQHVAPFRPLQLSIYVPGNELPTLPMFSDDLGDKDNIPPVPEVPRPPQAVMKAKSEAVLTRPLSNFSVPRAPFLSSQSSMEFGRTSTDSEMTMVEQTWRPRTSSLSYNRSRRPSNATMRSNHEFMELINAPLPPLPSLNTKTTETKSEESHPTIVRSASEQSKRLQAHLQEREQVQAEMSSPDCSTIAEERSPTTSPRVNRHRSLSAPSRASVSSPAPHGLAITDAVSSEAGILTTTQVSQTHDFASPLYSEPTKVAENDTESRHRDSITLNRALSAPSRCSQDNIFPRSSTSSATLLNRSASTGTPDITARLQSAFPPPTISDPFTKPSVTTTVTALYEKSSMTTVSQRLTQWLSRSKSLSKESLRSMSATPDAVLRSEAKVELVPEPLKITRPTLDEKSFSEPQVTLTGPALVGKDMRNSVYSEGDDKSERSWFDTRHSIIEPEQKLGGSEKWVVGSGGGIVRQRSGTESTYVEKGGLDLFSRSEAKFGIGELSFGPDVNEVSAVGLAM